MKTNQTEEHYLLTQVTCQCILQLNAKACDTQRQHRKSISFFLLRGTQRTFIHEGWLVQGQPSYIQQGYRAYLGWMYVCVFLADHRAPDLTLWQGLRTFKKGKTTQDIKITSSKIKAFSEILHKPTSVKTKQTRTQSDSTEIVVLASHLNNTARVHIPKHSRNPTRSKNMVVKDRRLLGSNAGGILVAATGLWMGTIRSLT